MSSLLEIRTALQNTIQTYLGSNSGAQVYDSVPGIANMPAIVVEPDRADFLGSMGAGTDEWYFNVMVFNARGADERLAQNKLDEFLTGHGPKSIRQAIFQNPTLGLSDCTAQVRGMRGYGGSTKAAGMGVMGAILTVCVYTS